MILSVLICTVTTRVTKNLPNILASLEKQIPAGCEDVELLYLGDNRLMDIGEKRNHLMKTAKGKYIVYVDDDDRIAPTYIPELLEAAKSDMDSIVFYVEITTNGKRPLLVKYSKDLLDKTVSWGYERKTNHIMAVKRSIALQHPFPEQVRGEDFGWAAKICPVMKSEKKIDKILYYYDYSTSESESGKRYRRYPQVYLKKK